MIHELDNKNKLLELLGHGARVITPNNRLSADLLYHYFKYSNQETVVKPQCAPYSTTIIKSFEQLNYSLPQQSHPELLNDAQCQHLWRIIIKDTPEITYSEGLLKAVMSAWKNCQHWQIAPEDQAFSYTPQTRTFQLWWQSFNKKLQELNAINEHQLIPYLLQAKARLFNTAIIWACFDEYTPQQIRLQSHLQQEGLTQYCYELKNQQSTPEVLATENSQDEYQHLIIWLQLKIEQGEQRIGVVVPNLQQESSRLKRALLQHFEPAQFNISLGEGLSEFPIVAHALSWLNCDPKFCSQQEAGLLLQSPYIGAAKEEFLQRSEYLQDNSLLSHQKCSFAALNKQLLSAAPKLAALLTSIKSYPKSASAHQWIQLFQERLNLIGFPGDYGLNSEQYQCYARFTTLFDEFRQLSVITPEMSFKEAINALTQLAKNTIFQAQKTNPPIQISGLLEASGCEFDSLWIMDLTDQCLPQKTQLSAFIPPQLQRELGMPHSSSARELQFANRVLQRFQQSCMHTIVFSYPKLQGESPNLPCSLITDFPKIPLYKATFETNKTAHLMTIDEAYKINILAKEQITGGTALLSNQAKCPFKAFAEHRLIAKAMPQTTDGIDNKEKGKAIHKTMELLWQQLGNKQQLLTITNKELNHIIDQAIQKALSPLVEMNPEAFSGFIQNIEYARLKRLVLSCLEWEKQRPDFEVIALEQSYSINIAGLEIKVRVDRLDQVDDKKWVIDYKSSLPVNKPWNEDRPQEPQLLLYALLDEQINTLLFMQIKTGKILCSGLSEIKQETKGISALKKDESWINFRDTWKQQLSLLAQEIQEGYCPPQPINSTLCGHCDFKNLCRIS